MNVELLQQVKEAILAKPEKYDQDTFCGTECCIAGWALTIANPVLGAKLVPGTPQLSWDVLWSAARQSIGLTPLQMGNLCGCAEDWPSDFAAQYDAATTPEGRARVGAARIDHFIANGGE